MDTTCGLIPSSPFFLTGLAKPKVYHSLRRRRYIILRTTVRIASGVLFSSDGFACFRNLRLAIPYSLSHTSALAVFRTSSHWLQLLRGFTTHLSPAANTGCANDFAHWRIPFGAIASLVPPSIGTILFPCMRSLSYLAALVRASQDLVLNISGARLQLQSSAFFFSSNFAFRRFGTPQPKFFLTLGVMWKGVICEANPSLAIAFVYISL